MGIDDYRKYFHEAEEWDITREGFPREAVLIQRYNLVLLPWEGWLHGSTNPPDWWTANNKIKHHRSTDFEKANLENVLNSMAALLHVNLFLICNYDKLMLRMRALERPKLLMLDNCPFINIDIEDSNFLEGLQ